MGANVAFLPDDEAEMFVEEQASVPLSSHPSKQYLDVLEGDDAGSEEILELVQRVFLPRAEVAPRIVVFAAVDRSCDSARVSALAAHHLAKSTRGSVCLVDANLRTPSLQTRLGVTARNGFADALANDAPLRSFTTSLAPQLWLMPSGVVRAESADLLSSDRAMSRMTELKDQFDRVIVNAPALGGFADTLALGQLTDGVVLIIEAAATRRESAQVAVARLRSSNIPVLGAVLNNRTFPIPGKIYAML